MRRVTFLGTLAFVACSGAETTRAPLEAPQSGSCDTNRANCDAGSAPSGDGGVNGHDGGTIEDGGANGSDGSAVVIGIPEAVGLISDRPAEPASVEVALGRKLGHTIVYSDTCWGWTNWSNEVAGQISAGYLAALSISSLLGKPQSCANLNSSNFNVETSPGYLPSPATTYGESIAGKYDAYYNALASEVLLKTRRRTREVSTAKRGAGAVALHGDTSASRVDGSLTRWRVRNAGAVRARPDSGGRLNRVGVRGAIGRGTIERSRFAARVGRSDRGVQSRRVGSRRSFGPSG